MTLLDDIIDGSSDGTVSSSDLLRQVRTAVHRLGAQEVALWAKRELEGYEVTADRPDYRRQLALGVRGGVHLVAAETVRRKSFQWFSRTSRGRLEHVRNSSDVSMLSKSCPRRRRSAV